MQVGTATPEGEHDKVQDTCHDSVVETGVEGTLGVVGRGELTEPVGEASDRTPETEDPIQIRNLS